jgi:hypothetical protein
MLFGKKKLIKKIMFFQKDDGVGLILLFNDGSWKETDWILKKEIIDGDDDSCVMVDVTEDKTEDALRENLKKMFEVK